MNKRAEWTDNTLKQFAAVIKILWGADVNQDVLVFSKLSGSLTLNKFLEAMETHEYAVNLVWTSGRRGQMTSPETDEALEVATPAQFNGGIEGVWSPEHYFTAAVVGCYMTTFLAIAEMSKLSFASFECDSDGILTKDDTNRYLMTKVILKPRLIIDHEGDFEKASKVLVKAEKACLISNSIKSEIELQPNILVSHLVN